MSKHTPGPWRREMHDNGAFDIKADDIVDGKVLRTYTIASRNPWTANAEESEANARLLASAPNLLAAAQMAYDAWMMPAGEFEKKYPANSSHEAVEMALYMALQEAKGEPA